MHKDWTEEWTEGNWWQRGQGVPAAVPLQAEVSDAASPPQICARPRWPKFAERENHSVFVPKGDFFFFFYVMSWTSVLVSHLLGIFCLAVTLRHVLGAKKQKPAGPLTLQSITGGYKAKLILCLAQKDMCQILGGIC